MKRFYPPFLFEFVLGKSFMEIEQTRALDGLALFGIVGGYVGIFLGVALMQMPDLLEYVYRKIFKKLN